MKNKILRRLVLYFIATFIVFGALIGVLFMALFSRHNVSLHHAELERRAVNIAQTLSGFISDSAGHRMGFRMGHGMGGLGMFLHYVEDIAMSDIWVVDRNADQIFLGRQHRHRAGMTFQELPEGSEQIIADAFNGIVTSDESFSLFWDRPTITVAAPVTLSGGSVAGVVLLHTEIADINQAADRGLALLLYSMGMAIIASVAVAVLLSTRFTRPLDRMKAAALEISRGDYNVKTQVRQNDEIGELAVVFDDMTEKLSASFREREKLDKLRQDFIANISHELRTPITVIRGSLEALLDGVVSDKDKVAEYLGQMYGECKHLERLVADLLDLSRLQNTDFAIEMQALDLKDVVKDAARTMTKIAEQKDVSLMLDCEDGGFAFTGDYGRLRQMLIIVVDNAVKFSPQGGEVEIRLTKEGETAGIRIRDRGQGIDPDDLAHIFERFYKQRSEQNKTGAGLGLAIAKQIADRHGITIDAANHPDGGANFLFLLALNAQK